MRYAITLAVLVGGALGCDAAEIVCEGEVEVDILAGRVAEGEVTREDVQIVGTARHTGGLAIRTLHVGGVAATASELNFGRWTATLKIAELAALQGSSSSPVEVGIEAWDACDKRTAVNVAPLRYTVDTSYAQRVTSLALEVLPPAEKGFLPADDVTTARVRLVANPEAANAEVALSTTFGTLEGATDGKLRLAGDGEAPATATALFRADRAGTVTITAVAQASLDTATLLVTAGPSLIPAVAILRAQDALPVTATSEGDVVSCQATPASGVSVTSGEANLMQAPGGTVANDGTIPILVEAEDTLAEMGTVVITCQDSFGQTGSGSYQFRP